MTSARMRVPWMKSCLYFDGGTRGARYFHSRGVLDMTCALLLTPCYLEPTRATTSWTLQRGPIADRKSEISNPQSASTAAATLRSIVVQNRADAAVLGESRRVGITEQVQVERLVGLLLVVAVHRDRDRLRRLAGGEGHGV